MCAVLRYRFGLFNKTTNAKAHLDNVLNTPLARRLGRLGISCRRAAISWSCTGDYGITHGSTGINRTRGAPLSAHTAICKRSLIYAITFNPSASDLESSEHDMCVSNETYFSARPHAQRWLSPVWRRARPFAGEVTDVRRVTGVYEWSCFC